MQSERAASDAAFKHHFAVYADHQFEPKDAAKLAALREAARIGMADFDAGRFSTFSDTSEMRKHLRSRAAKVIAKTKRG
jgi:hypothetical protein